MTDLTGAVWRTSSRSNDQGLCVEVATNVVAAHGVVGIRDSKDPAGPALAVSPPGWMAFVAAIQADTFRS